MTRVAIAPVESGTLAAKIQARLEEAIYIGELRPGQRLVETDLAEALNVSRASFREALRLLQSKGLVVAIPRRGTFVTEITEGDVRDIYTLRTLLEGFAIRQAAMELPAGLLARLDLLVEELGHRAAIGDHIGIVDLDLEIHRAICESTGNRKLLDLWEMLVAPVRALLLIKYRVSDDSSVIKQGHENLVETIRRRSPDRAEELLRSHIVDTAEMVLRILRNEGDPDAVDGERADEATVNQDELARIAPLLGRDQVIRGELMRAVAAGRVTAHGLEVLRDQYALTPAETLVFITYYLAENEIPGNGSTRRHVSRQLNLSENTLMHHISSIRRKLGLGARRGSANVLMWALSAGIIDLPEYLPDRSPTTAPAGSGQQ